MGIELSRTGHRNRERAKGVLHADLFRAIGHRALIDVAATQDHALACRDKLLSPSHAQTCSMI